MLYLVGARVRIRVRVFELGRDAAPHEEHGVRREEDPSPVRRRLLGHGDGREARRAQHGQLAAGDEAGDAAAPWPWPLDIGQ